MLAVGGRRSSKPFGETGMKREAFDRMELPEGWKLEGWYNEKTLRHLLWEEHLAAAGFWRVLFGSIALLVAAVMAGGIVLGDRRACRAAGGYVDCYLANVGDFADHVHIFLGALVLGIGLRLWARRADTVDVPRIIAELREPGNVVWLYELKRIGVHAGEYVVFGLRSGKLRQVPMTAGLWEDARRQFPGAMMGHSEVLEETFRRNPAELAALSKAAEVL